MSQHTDAELQPPVVVTIYDQPYRLRSGRGNEHVRRVAQLVDARMREVAEHMTTFDLTKIAVLTALNFADELESQREDHAQATAAASPADSDTQTASEASNADAQASAPNANGERRSWFEEIFEAEEQPPTRDGERLSSQISAKLHSRRRD
jgi:cell division protein ZapA